MTHEIAAGLAVAAVTAALSEWGKLSGGLRRVLVIGLATLLTIVMMAGDGGWTGAELGRCLAAVLGIAWGAHTLARYGARTVAKKEE